MSLLVCALHGEYPATGGICPRCDAVGRNTPEWEAAQRVAPLVRAIRRAHPGEVPIGVIAFRVDDIFAFAAALMREGVRVDDERKEAA